MDFINYEYFKDYKSISLEGLYNGQALDNLDYNLKKIIEIEAPITLNILKERLREELNIKKISQNALDIILLRIDKLGFVKTNNLYDITLWPKSGIFKIKAPRMSKRQIYDIPYEELEPLKQELISKGLKGEAFYREVLKQFGYSVLTKKALEYLRFVEQ